MNRIKEMVIVAGIFFIPGIGHTKTVPFDLHIQGEIFAVQKSLELSDVGEGKTRSILILRIKQEQNIHLI